MKKGNPNPTYKFPKGQSGNPNGRPKIPNEFKKLRASGKYDVDLIGIIHKYVNMDMDDIVALIKAVSKGEIKLPAKEALVARQIERAWAKGEVKSYDVIYDRIMGKVANNVKLDATIEKKGAEKIVEMLNENS